LWQLELRSDDGGQRWPGIKTSEEDRKGGGELGEGQWIHIDDPQELAKRKKRKAWTETGKRCGLVAGKKEKENQTKARSLARS
jgi:hypothetical protein